MILLTIEELAAMTGISIRTIRYYITSGLLSGPEGRGRAASYTEEHLLRLRLIRRLSEQRFSIAEMQDLLQRLSFAEVRALVLESEDQSALHFQSQPSAKEYIDSLLKKAQHAREFNVEKKPSQRPDLSSLTQKKEDWQRVELAPGLELHIRSSSERRYRHLIQHLLTEVQKQTFSDHD